MTTTQKIKIEEITKYLDPNEDYSNLEVDLDGNYSMNEREITNLIDITDKSQLQKLKIEVERKHPRIIEKEETRVYPICLTNTGIIGCGKESNKSDLHQYGLGIINYFKTLKAFSIIFFIIIIVNIPLYIMYTQSNSAKKAVSYQDALFKTTIGNIATKLNNCKKISTKEFNFPYKYADVKLNCEQYMISSINLFGVSPDSFTEIHNNRACQDFSSEQNITISDTCSFSKNVTDLANYCIGNGTSTCKLEFDVEAYSNQCKGMNNMKYFFLGYTCLDNDLPIGKWEISRNVAAIVVIALDVASIIIVLIALLVISISQKKNAEIYTSETNQISDYSIHIKGIDLDNKNINKEFDDLLQHLHNVLKSEIPRFENHELTFIYDVNYPILNDYKLDLVIKKNALSDQLAQLKRKLKFKEANLKSNEIEEIKGKIDLKNDELDKVIKDLDYADNEIVRINDVWITFNRMKFSRELLKVYNRYNKCDRFCIICCYQKKKINKY